MSQDNYTSPQKTGRFKKRSGSLPPLDQDELSSIQQQNGDLNLSTLSPNPSGHNMLAYRSINLTGDDVTTQDMSRIHAYKSAAKIKMGKKAASNVLSPTNQSQSSTLKPIRNPTWDGDGLPKVISNFKR